MVDRSKRVQRSLIPLEELPLLKGRRRDFSNVAEMITHRAEEFAENRMVLYYEDVISYGEVNERANRVASFLINQGVSKGDIVSVMVLNSPEIYYTMFGAQKIGAIAGAINYMLKGPEIAYVLDDSKPKVAFVGSEYMVEFARGVSLAKHKPLVVEVKTEVEHGQSIAATTLTDILQAYPAVERLTKQSLDDPFLLLYSSGTTGVPKGILLSNRNQLAICKGKATFGLSEPGDVILIILPMFHVNPLCVWTYPTIYLGLTLCIRKTFSPKEFWHVLTRYGVTTVQGVPAMYAYVYNIADPSTIEFDKLKLRLAYTGAAPMPVELIRGFKEKYGVQVIDGYGLTEATGVSTTCSLVPENIGSIGVAFPGLEVEIMDDDNNIMPYGERGEICVKGEAVMLGYLNKPEATAETIKDGWLHTGDMGWMDERGYVYISGRKKEMINRGGENIYPREIEIPLEQHPAIEEVAVIGAPDPALGERVRAVIRLKDGFSLTAEEVKTYLEDKIAKYKIPEYVNFVKEFPRNPTGKILKQELKKLFS
ncbi:MAG: AMP-binding protein [Syntrophales bacterium]|nr:AMP-binding protein [Syntrophales bacterium]